ncbi:hypothetical protein P691DRAFT_150724 [Macrolepiota fuliginosa MF-IS2]|uniref:NACHT domain-containing protein n=1 Tax=Macrolepiota fuliginosa MF-IS2 TaxID=1400762 RepID=A0A9P6C958_9AGAR|nr:hypothetical protein P691DRAFT_150724 [Macrolepiota fuliginosa MF-IS2]
MPLGFFSFFQKKYQFKASDPNATVSEQPQEVETGSQPFHGAHDFAMNNPTFIDKYQIIESINDGNTVLERLAKEMIEGAEMDSSVRHPPPKCYPGTRTELTSNILTWVAGPDRNWNMLWIHGPAGVGKSAVAQTIAEHCEQNGRLGAAFFFSRLNRRDEPSRVFITIAFQIAVRNPAYKQIIAEQLAADPSILKKAIQIQFRKLIVEPFSILAAKDPAMFQHPLVIIIDGLDECNGEEAQCEIIDLINEAVRSSPLLPLLWVLCSRPECHLQAIFSRADFEIHCWREEMRIDSTDGRRDVARYIRDNLKDIRNKYQVEPAAKTIGRRWPSKRRTKSLIKAADGLFVIASIAIRFIGDSDYANPATRLDAFLKIIKTSQVVGMRNPMEYLDMLYGRILADVPKDVLPITMKLLGFGILFRTFFANVQALANLMELNQSSVYGALRKLHSVLKIPPPEHAGRAFLEFYHASFADYLQNPARSGKYCIDEREVACSVAKGCLRFVAKEIELRRTEYEYTEYHPDPWQVKQEKAFHLRFLGDNSHLTWKEDFPISSIQTSLWVPCQIHLLEACIRTGDLEDKNLFQKIRSFDFSGLAHTTIKRSFIEMRTFEVFIKWLHTSVRRKYFVNFVRTKGASSIDDKILQACSEKLENAAPYDLSPTFLDQLQPAPYPMKGHRDRSAKRFLLLGYGSKTALVILYSSFGKDRFLTLTPQEALTSEQIKGRLFPDSKQFIDASDPD